MSSFLLWLLMATLGLGLGSQRVEAEVTRVQPAPLAGPTSTTPSADLARLVAERDLLPPCGMLDLAHPRTPGTMPASHGWDCLTDGFDRHGAELLTVEALGPRDRTRHQILRALPDGRLEIWTQVTHTEGFDLVSHWSYRTCAPSDDLGRQPCAP